jgi:hypothetical protein
VGENKVMHRYSTQHDRWTLCGRYVSSNEGSHNVSATDIDDEVTCKACVRRKGERKA